MKVELKQVVDQLTEYLDLPVPLKVSALVEDETIVGWTIVHVYDDRTIKPITSNKFKNIKELCDNNYDIVMDYLYELENGSK